MLTLIAESKTMETEGYPIDLTRFESHSPVGEETADDVMAHIATLNPPELATVAKLSGKMAAKAIAMAYEFPNKAIGREAIESFTGVVFRSFDYGSLTDADRDIIAKELRIISSLYGYLRPDDIIKPYRLDFTTPLAPGDVAMARYWKKDVTITLVREIKERGVGDILNLLPGDASKSIDWKLVKHFARVWKVDFKELKDGVELRNGESDSGAIWRTPASNRLKELRGHLLREIVTRRLTTPRDLLTLETDRLLPLGTPDYPDHIAFCV